MKVFKEIKGGVAIDDRGSLSFINDFDAEKLGIKRFYIVQNHNDNFVRAWHGHRTEKKYVYCIEGTALLGIISFENMKKIKEGSSYPELDDRIILDARVSKLIEIPNMYYNGFKLLTRNTKLMFFSTSTLEESANDDFRETGMLDLLDIKER